MKVEDVNRLNAKLSLLSKINEAFKITDDPFLIPNLPAWEVSVVNLYQDWVKTNSTITFKEYALYHLFQRKPSVSSCSSLLREVEKLFTAIKEFLLKRDCYCWEREGILYIKEPLTEDLLFECKEIINKYSGKSIGLIPIYWYEINKKPISLNKQRGNFHRVKEWKWGSSIHEEFLILQFENNETVKIRISKRGTWQNTHRFYRKNSIGQFLHLSSINVGDSILWFFPLERY
ncbi:MAG: hypothetical protein DDT40_00605 [candidate division WS2 bacterium]|nr:hypothetical protein [Candidatus Psychracetigena formicireducens]